MCQFFVHRVAAYRGPSDASMYLRQALGGTSFLASRALENVPDIRHSDRGMNGATTLPLPTNSDARLLTGYLIPIVVQVGLLVLLLG